jgi:hypothetical protein
MPRMADGSGVVVDVCADDRMRAGSAPFAMGKFALRGLAQRMARELAKCLDRAPKKKYRRADKETGLAGARRASECETFDGRWPHRGTVAFGNPFAQSAKTESKPAMARSVGVVRSSASVSDTKLTPNSASSFRVATRSTRDRPTDPAARPAQRRSRGDG